MADHFLQYDVQPSIRELRCPKCDGPIENYPAGIVYSTYPAQYPYRCKSCGHEFTSTYKNEVLYRPIPGTEKIVTIGDEPNSSDKSDITVM